jgi:hypothetical protein
MIRRVLTWLEYVIARVLTDPPRVRVLYVRGQQIEQMAEYLYLKMGQGYTPDHFRKAAEICRVNNPHAALAFEACAERLEIAEKIHRTARPTTARDGWREINHREARRWSGLEVRT